MEIGSYQDFLTKYHLLRQRYKDSCLWFEADEVSDDPLVIKNTLRQIELHGDRDAFILTRKLNRWLLQYSNIQSVS